MRGPLTGTEAAAALIILIVVLGILLASMVTPKDLPQKEQPKKFQPSNGKVEIVLDLEIDVGAGLSCVMHNEACVDQTNPLSSRTLFHPISLPPNPPPSAA